MTRDTAVAIFLLLLCGVFVHASFDIRETAYGTPGAELWPRAVLTLLTVLSFVYLAQSLKPGPARRDTKPGGLAGFRARHGNALWCFALFTLFLGALPVLGMLVAGILFVFATLSVLGSRSFRAHLLHASVAVVTVGAMWSLFSFGLGVMLPEGTMFQSW